MKRQQLMKMGCDFTYIHTLRNDWFYQSSVFDLHTKKIVGYSFSTSMTPELVLKFLTNALDVLQPDEGLILYTDLDRQ
ncbi:DDE-type integrase/transposase/recombinase [Mammaliicoccus sciuri]